LDLEEPIISMFSSRIILSLPVVPARTMGARGRAPRFSQPADDLVDRCKGSGVESFAGDICIGFPDRIGQLLAHNEQKRRPAGMDERIHGSAPASACKFQRAKLIHDDKVRPWGCGYIECLTT
jgi:hypothetical protein